MRARPISGGTLRILADGRTAVAADADRDLIYVVDLVSGVKTSTIALQSGDEPGRLVEDAAGRVHVALRGGGSVVTIDPKLPAQDALVARRSLCAAPRGLAYDAAADQLHVACAGGELVSIAATPSVTKPARTVTVDRDLRDVVVSTNGRLMVSTFRTALVYTVDGSGNVSAPQGLTRDRANHNPGVAWRMLGRPDGGCMMLHELAPQTQTLGVFPGAYGSQSQCGAIVSSTVTVVAPDGSSGLPAAPMTNTVVGADVAVSPDGAQMAVVSIAAGDTGTQVQFYDVAENGDPGPNAFNGCWPNTTSHAGAAAGTDTGAAGDDLGPPAIALPPSGQVVAVAYDARGNVIVQSREPANLQILTQRRDAISLSDDSRFDAGHQLFHSATSGQIACVSCHPEGGEDGRVWTFQGFGARRTQSLRGGIMDTAPFHWSGDEANMTSLMHDVFQGRMSGGTVDDARTTALAQWLDQIPTVPASRRADDATVARGTKLFMSSGCAVCHSGPDFTNNMTVDVGTGGMFQVPQLHGLGLRAPYMHNGCAATLQARFSSSCGGDSRHLVGGMLTDTQVTDLIGYLETL
jgi:DNA-binding beta-propeller fold protein YncE